MKLALLLCIFGTLFLVCHTSPVPVPLEKTSEIVTSADDKKDVDVVKASGRQATNDIAPSPDDDDDDDEDDDDDDDEEDVIGGVLDDDDDDDEDDDDEDDTPQGQAAPSSDDDEDDEEDDDDEEGDLESFFEDFAGDDDDDDDDEEEELTNQQVANVIVPAAASAVVPGPEGASVSDGTGIDTKVDVQSLNEDNGGVPSASIGSAEKGHGAGLGVGHHHHHSHLVQFGHHKGSGSSSSSGSEEGDDDIVVGDYIDTERSFRSLDEESVSQNEIFQDKHNAFIDAIFTRINKMLSDSYDPLNVQLSARSKNFKGKSNDGKQHSKKSKGRKQAAPVTTKHEEKSNSVDDSSLQVASLSVAGELRANQPTSSAATSSSSSSVPLKKSTYSGNVAGFNSNSNSNRITSSKPLKSNNNKTKQSGLNTHSSNKEQLEKAEATLYGLATLKRIGNVKIITDPEGKNSTIKTKFTLGPLKLKVEKAFKRGSVRSVKSATAVTNEMVGRMKFRVLDNSATLMSIKVQQPKQVEVESKDNHDRTRKFVWEKTPQLAHLVSENLKLAIDTSFVPEPPQVVRL